MALTKFTGAVNNITTLADQPNATSGLTPAEVKAKFDKTGADLKTFVNDTMTVEVDGIQTELTTHVADSVKQFVPKQYIFGEQLAQIRYALSNPLEQYMSIVFIGDSITWGMIATGNPELTPRDGTLSDVRDLFESQSFVNNFKRYIGSKYAFDAIPVLSNWSASTSGESIVEYSKENIMFPYEGDFETSLVAPVADPVIVSTSSNSLAGMQLNLNVNSGTSGSHSLKFNFTGKEFTLAYASVVNSMKYELIVDGVSQGIFDTAPGIDGNIAGFNNQRTHTFDYIKDKQIEIKTVLGDYIGKNTLKIDGIKINKKIKISNQGIIGATTRSYLANNLDGNTSGDGVAISDEDKYIFMQLGTNDRIITDGVAKGVNEYKKNLKTILDLIKTGREVVLMCANPSANENPSVYSFNMQDVRNATYQVAKENKIDFVDNYSIFGDMSTTDFTADTLHPNDYGHDVISRNIINSLELNGAIPNNDVILNDHLTETISEVISTSRDISIDGTQVVTGFSMIPKRLDIYGVVATTPVMSIGNKSNNAETCIAILNDGTTNSLVATIMLGQTNANYTKGTVTINSDKTITINWTKVGTGATGTAAIKIIAHYH